MREYRSWGRAHAASHRVRGLFDRRAPMPLPDTGFALPYGNGRSYGDVCLNDGGTLLDARGLDRFIAFDPASGVVECEAGVRLGELIDLVLPKGWFLPVTPGTRFVTVGGAIANDVHGKNHHRAGSFGLHVLALELARSDGSVRRCAPDENADWLAATIGGLGLTGLIRSARLQLRPCPGSGIRGQRLRFANLAEFFALSKAMEPDWEYTVAWVDAQARGAALGRGVFVCGNHDAAAPEAPPARAWRLPLTPPFSLIHRSSATLFNQLYFRRQAPREEGLRHYRPFFYPLDGIEDWNRLYGPRGLLQYQCVLPMAEAEASLAEMLRSVAASGEASPLSVLKCFGDTPTPGLLSFARPGVTLALDFPHRGTSTLALLDRLDAITAEAGGALYPAKDGRMPPALFRAGYPGLMRFRDYRDPALRSDFWRRMEA